MEVQSTQREEYEPRQVGLMALCVGVMDSIVE